MAQMRKRGLPSVKETFIKSDPNLAVSNVQSNPQMMTAGPNYLSIQSGGDKLPNDMSSSKSSGPGMDLASLCKYKLSLIIAYSREKLWSSNY